MLHIDSQDAPLARMQTAIASLLAGSCFFAFWFWLLPGWLGFQVEAAGGARWRWLAVVPSVLGFSVALRCVWDFGWTGHGTPAPFIPPQKLVVTGFYRYVRNPSTWAWPPDGSGCGSFSVTRTSPPLRRSRPLLSGYIRLSFSTRNRPCAGNSEKPTRTIAVTCAAGGRACRRGISRATETRVFSLRVARLQCCEFLKPLRRCSLYRLKASRMIGWASREGRISSTSTALPSSCL